MFIRGWTGWRGSAINAGAWHRAASAGDSDDGHQRLVASGVERTWRCRTVLDNISAG